MAENNEELSQGIKSCKEAEGEIRCIIDEVTHCKYVGKLKVDREKVEGEDDIWMLLLYLDLEQTPIVLAYQGAYDKFKEFICKEMYNRKMQLVKFWTAIKDYEQGQGDSED